MAFAFWSRELDCWSLVDDTSVSSVQCCPLLWHVGYVSDKDDFSVEFLEHSSPSSPHQNLPAVPVRSDRVSAGSSGLGWTKQIR